MGVVLSLWDSVGEAEGQQGVEAELHMGNCRIDPSPQA